MEVIADTEGSVTRTGSIIHRDFRKVSLGSRLFSRPVHPNNFVHLVIKELT